MKDGTRYENSVRYSKGHPLHDPLTMEELQAKYRACAGRLLPEKQVEASMEAILSLEQAEDVSRVMDLLVKND